MVSRHRETTSVKLIVINFAEIQNWNRCLWPKANCPAGFMLTAIAQWLTLELYFVATGSNRVD